MKREFLQGLQDSDGNPLELSKEIIDSIMKEHGTTVSGLKGELEIEKGKVATLTTNSKTMEDALNKLDGVDVEKLNTEIKTLTTQIATDKQAYEENIKKITAENAFNNALSDALRSAKVKNPKAIKALLDMENIKLDGTKLLGLSNQLEALQESDAYLFDEAEPSDLGGGGNPANARKPKPDTEKLSDDDFFAQKFK